MRANASHAAAPGDSTPGPEEPVVIKMNNQRTKLGAGMPVSAPAQLTCTPTCATTPTCAATETCSATPTCAATLTTQMNDMPLDLSQSVSQV